MSGARDKADAKPKTSRRALDLSKPDDLNSPERIKARSMLLPAVGAAITVEIFNKQAGDLPLTELVQELTQQTLDCSNGKLVRGEAIYSRSPTPLSRYFTSSPVALP